LIELKYINSRLTIQNPCLKGVSTYIEDCKLQSIKKHNMSQEIENIFNRAEDLVYDDKVGTIELYSNAIDIIKERGDKEDDVYYNILAHYHILDISKNLERGKNIKAYKTKAIEYAHKCIDLVVPFLEEDESNYNTTYTIIVKEASIKIAKELYDNAVSIAHKPKLEEALEIIEIGAKYQEGYDKIHFTKAQILLKLKRNEEAYTTVEKAMAEDADTDDYEEIIKSKGYQEWYDSRPEDFNDEEIEFLTKAKRILNNISSQSIIPEDADKSNSYTAKVIDLKEAIEEYGFEDVSYISSLKTVLVIEGDLYINGNLNVKWIKTEAKKYDPDNITSNLIVLGNLYVDGDIDDERVDDLISLKITKDVYANNITTSDGFKTFQGTTYVKYVMYGHYNDGHLYTNDIYCPYFICDDHEMPTSATNESISINGAYYGAKQDVYIDADNEDGYLKRSDRLFNPEVWVESEFDIGGFFYLVSEGINPFKEVD